MAFISSPFPLSYAQRYQADGIFKDPQSANLYGEMTQIENRLYGHPYMDETMNKRLQRMEKTLYGAPQTGTLESRFLGVKRRMNLGNVAKTVTPEERTMTFLEQRFFQQTYEDATTEVRLQKLESYVFGKTFEQYPVAQRIKKLTYTVPITAKEIRLTKEGRVMATTHPKKKKAVVREPDYFDAVFRLPDTRLLRWTALPAKVFVRSGTPEEKKMVSDAVSLWNGVYPIRIAETSDDADIMMDWEGQNSPVRFVTRPITQMNSQHQIRTAIHINMSPYRGQPEDRQIRGVLHQLGHASGIWGHSDNPQDVMYAANRLEASDFPEKWNRGAIRFSSEIPEPALLELPSSPSERDRNTMTRIYSTPGQDIRLFSP